MLPLIILVINLNPCWHGHRIVLFLANQYLLTMLIISILHWGVKSIFYLTAACPTCWFLFQVGHLIQPILYQCNLIRLLSIGFLLGHVDWDLIGGLNLRDRLSHVMFAAILLYISSCKVFNCRSRWFGVKPSLAYLLSWSLKSCRFFSCGVLVRLMHRIQWLWWRWGFWCFGKG